MQFRSLAFSLLEGAFLGCVLPALLLFLCQLFLVGVLEEDPCDQALIIDGKLFLPVHCASKFLVDGFSCLMPGLQVEIVRVEEHIRGVLR